MGDQLKFQPGAFPWRPTEDVELEHVFHKYNYPLAGVIKQAGNRFFFSLIEDVLDEWSVWAYVLVEEADIESLRDRDAARRYIEEHATHPVFLAVARDAHIMITAMAPPLSSEEPFLKSVLDSLADATDAFKGVEELSA